MIRLYRCIQHPEETLVTFDGALHHLAPLARILQFHPQPSKLADSYEKGYFAYIRGENRVSREQQTQSYLAANFQPPEIHMLLFRSTQALPVDRAPGQWIDSVQQAIIQSFLSKGYFTKLGGLQFEIYRKQADSIGQNLRAHEGVTFRVRVGTDYYAQLQCDACYRFVYKDKPIRDNREVQKLAVNDPAILTAVKDYTCRDCDMIFQLAQRFVKGIPQLPIVEGFSFDPNPLSAKALGLETWFWGHEQVVAVEGAGGAQMPLAQHIIKYGKGMFSVPTRPVFCVLLHPSAQHNSECPFHEWTLLQQMIQDKFDALLVGRTSADTRTFEYDVESNADFILEQIRVLLEEQRGGLPLVFIVAPPKDNGAIRGSILCRIDHITSGLAKGLRRLARGAYTITLGWDGLASNYEREYVVENALLKGLTVLGGIPWRMHNMPLDSGQAREDVCLIGVDVNPYKSEPVVGGVVFDAYAVPRGWHLIRLPQPNGDRIDPPSLAQLIEKLLFHYERTAPCAPKHVIVHRDGLVGEESRAVAPLESALGVRIDLVEVLKSGTPRMRQEGNAVGTPSKDVAVGSMTEGYAFMNNTLVVRERLSSGRFVFSAPDSLTMKRIVGSTTAKTLAAQVYICSLANSTTFRRTERLPCTIAFADALVNNASLKAGQRDIGRPIDGSSTLYWL